jgi:hypothetical protein
MRASSYMHKTDTITRVMLQRMAGEVIKDDCVGWYKG